MSHSEPARIAAGRVTSTILAAAVLVSATLGGVVSWQAGDSSLASAAASLIRTLWSPRAKPGKADGVLAAGVTVFDASPAVTRLHPALLGALRRAARDAKRHRVEIVINSGWRSPQYQEQLLREAVSKYGSAKEAARWVATVDASSHVSGNAVDIGPSNATAWLAKRGAAYGLCRTYRNEPWHYELRPAAIDDGCPRMYADPRHDPRTKQ
jgi:zinc D-Ala-D-Ala carboxypeptidase